MRRWMRSVRPGDRGVSEKRESTAAARFASDATGGDILQGGDAARLGGCGARGSADAARRSCQLREEGRVDRAGADLRVPGRPFARAWRLSRLAREELKHFEQVERLMKKLDVPHVRMKPGRYASELRKLVRTHEPKRKLDLMIVHALIEARSCERFRLLAPSGCRSRCAICTNNSSAPRRATSRCIWSSREREFEADGDRRASRAHRDARGRARHRARQRAAIPLRPAAAMGQAPFPSAAAGISRTPLGVDRHAARRLVPGREHHALGVHAVDHDRDVRPGDACGRGSAAARRWRARRAVTASGFTSMMVGNGALGVRLAAGARGAREQSRRVASGSDRKRRCQAGWRTMLRSCLVGGILGAEHVAVAEQRRHAVQLDQHRIRQ